MLFLLKFLFTSTCFKLVRTFCNLILEFLRMRIIYINFIQKVAFIVFQFFQLKYGFKAVLDEFRVKKLQKIFKKKFFQVESIRHNEYPFVSIKWEDVGYQNFQSGRPSRKLGLTLPKPHFMHNIETYKFNRFLDIGKVFVKENV